MEINYILICQTYSSNYLEIQFYLSTSTYHTIIYGVGLVLGFLTLKAKSDAFNDYHYNTAIIFVTSVYYLLYTTPQTALPEYLSLLAFYEEFNVFLLTMLFLGLTFIPKVHLYIDNFINWSIFVYSDDCFIQRSTGECIDSIVSNIW